MATHRRTLIALLALTLLACSLPGLRGAEPFPAADNIAALINPQKLATLGQRGANPRVQKAVYWLVTAGQQGQSVTNVAALAASRAGYTNAFAEQLTRDALLRNVKIAEGYQCTNAAGMADMRRGQSPTIQRSSFQGDQLSVDHIIPRAVCPELDNVIANLELMPLRANMSKNAKVGSRQVQKAEELHRAGLLSTEGLAKVQESLR